MTRRAPPDPVSCLPDVPARRSGRGRRLATAWLTILLLPAAALASTPVDEELHAVVDRFLVSLGEGDLDAVEAMFVPEANVGVVRFRDGAWVGSTEMFSEYMTRARERQEKNPDGARFREPIDAIRVTVESDQLAFVRAETTIYRDGREVSRPVDYFTLIRIEGEWKFLSAAYIVRRKEGE